MSIRKLSVLSALGAALLFSLLSVFPAFKGAENKIYDAFLRFRPERKSIDHVVFLDVDDQAIAHVGVFPWPRSVMAGGLLRLKEYGAETALFDIEYIDKSPTQVDELYLRQGLRMDYNRRFSEIGAGIADLLSAISAGNIRGAEASDYTNDIIELIQEEEDALFRETLKITRDDDTYLAQAAALFGNAWGTVNLQDEPLEGEQAERRIIAEQKFSYPVSVHGVSGGDSKDILLPIPSFMEAFKGAGFTNIVVDGDGIRRRVFLVREVNGHWYLQLAFAPLLERLGRPEIALYPRRLILKGADGKDMVIPLDDSGAMLLDWPKGTYLETYSHVSFVLFSLLEEYQNHIEQYLNALAFANTALFPRIAESAAPILAVFETAETAKTAALGECSDREFERYIKLRDEGLDLTRAFSVTGAVYLEEMLQSRADAPAELQEEAQYCNTLLEYLETELKAMDAVHGYLQKELQGKLCIIGRVDTGTTDIGVNPFYGEYVNVGTHGVVLDTILSQSFITLLSPLWSVIFTFLFVPAFIIGISGPKPVLRIALGGGGVMLILGFSFSLFRFTGYFLGPLGSVLAMITALIIRETLAFAGTEQEKQFIRKAFSTYLSADVVQEILADPGKLQLGGAKRHMTALFTDVQGFSTISEKLDPEELVRLLNDYLSAMSTVVLDQRGTIDKYEGDAIIAFFGAPVDVPDHALRACTSAVMMKKIELGLNKKYAENRLSPYPLLTRIGINTGSMVVGNMGTQQKMDYTIMGNAVNLAARLEGVNKQYGTWILASEDTIKETGGKMVSRRLDRVRVVGINEPVRLCEILDLAETAPAALLKKVDLFHQALALFETREWAKAEAAFLATLETDPDDKPAELYRKRCEQYRQTPPAPDWDGVFNLNQK